jgi:hypothetical protein
MDKNEVSETVSGILLLYLFVTSVFTLLSIFSNLSCRRSRSGRSSCAAMLLDRPCGLIVAALVFYRRSTVSRSAEAAG